MSIYEGIAVLAFLLTLPVDKVKNSKFIVLLFIVILTIVAAFRGLSVGTDTYAYYEGFNDAKTIIYGRTSDREPLFALYTYLCHRFLNYDWYMLVTYGIMIYSILWIAYKKTTNFPLSVFLFVTCGFYLSCFNGMREYLASAITFVALYVLGGNNKRKDIIFFLLTIAAALIHNTALIILLIYFIRNSNIPNTTQIILVIGSFIIGFFFSDFFWGNFQPFISAAGRFGTYLEYDGGSGSRNLISNMGVNVMFLVVMYLSSKNDQADLFYKAYFVSMIIFNLVGSMDILTRITDNIAIAQIVTIPIVLRHTKKPFYKISLLVLLLFYSVSRFYLKGLSNPDILPYLVRPYNTSF